MDVHEYAHWGRVLLALKTTEGVHHDDTAYAARVRWAHALGLTVLHYHFARPDLDTTPTDEATHFCHTIIPHLHPGDYLCVDVERTLTKGSGLTFKWVEDFCGLVHHLTGHTPIVYANESTLNTLLRKLRVPGQRYWVAKYGEGKPSLPRGMNVWAWQYTDGTIGPMPHDGPGIGPCDNSIMSRKFGLTLRLRTLRRRRRGANKAS